MDPATVLILGTVKAVAEAIAEGFRYAQTPAGQAAAKKLLEDAVAREKWAADAGAWLKRALTGEVLK
jgi:hypothetical protein